MTELTGIKHNVHEVCGKDVVRVQADIDKKVYDYFFRHVLAYSHGSRQAMITFFFQRFYEECLKQGIQMVWDDENDAKVVELLNRLNFDQPVHGVGSSKKSKRLPKHVRVLEVTGRAE